MAEHDERKRETSFRGNPPPPAVKRTPSFAARIMSQSKYEEDDDFDESSTSFSASFKPRASVGTRQQSMMRVDSRALMNRSSSVNLFSPEGSPGKETLTRLVNEEDLRKLIENIQRGLGPQDLNLRAQLDAKMARLTPVLLDAVGSCDNVQALNLGYNTIVDTLSSRLAQAFSVNHSLTTLHLGSIGLSEASCVRLVKALRGNASGRVKQLFLGRNKAGRQTAETLAEAISCGEGGLAHLQVLSLSNNRIGDDGGAALCDALLSNRHMRALDVGSNMLGAKTCTALAVSLRENAALREMRIERNPDLETERLSEVIVSIVQNEQSALRTIHSLEPLSKFCWDPAIRRNSGEWDNTKVMRFVREVRNSCETQTDPTRMFPIDVVTWEQVKQMMRRREADLARSVLPLWLEAAQRCQFTRSAVDGMLQGPGKQYRLQRFWYLWRDAFLILVAEREKEPGFLRKLEGVVRSAVLVGFAVWRLGLKHRGLIPCGKRCHLSEQMIGAARRRFGAQKVQECLEWRQACHASDVVWRHRRLRTATRILLRYFLAWGGLCVIKHAAVAVAQQMKDRARAYKALNGCFNGWSSHVERKARLRRKGQRLGMSHPRKMMRLCLSSWTEATRTEARLKRKGELVLQMYGSSLVKGMWVSWMVFLDLQHSSRLKAGKATRAVLQKWFKKLASKRKEAAAEGDKWQIAGRNRRKRLVRAAMTAFRGHRDRSLTLRSKAGKLVGSSARHQQRRHLWVWREEARKARMQRQKVRSARGKGQKGAEKVVFMEWEAVRRRSLRAKLHQRRALLARALRHLRVAAEESKEARTAAQSVLGRVADGARVDVFGAWCAWREMVAEAAELREKGMKRAANMSRAVGAGKRRTGMLSAFSRWMSHYLEALRQEASHVQLVEARYRLFRTFTAWQCVRSGVQSLRRKLQRNRANKRRTRMATLFGAWVHFVTSETAGRVAHGLALFRLGGRMLLERRVQARNVIARLARRVMLDVRKAFEGWQWEVLEMRAKDEGVWRQAAHFRRWFDKGQRQISLLSCFVKWRSLYCVQLSQLKGSLAFRGGLPTRELRAVARKAESPLPSELLGIDEFGAAGDAARVVEQVLNDWWEHKEAGSVEHAVELHRFWSLLSGGWAGSSIPMSLRVAKVLVVPEHAPFRVTHADSESEGTSTTVEIPKVESKEVMERRVRRAINIGLDLEFRTLLTPPCDLLAAAKHLCEVFLQIPSACLDVRGDHEAWPGPSHEAVHVKMIGNPPKPAPVPEGWARVGLRLDEAVVGGHDVWKEWHVSYHGTRRELLREIVMSRMLLLPGDINCRGKTVHAPPGHLSHSLHHSKRLVILPGPGHHSAPGASYGMTLNGHPFNGSHNASSIGGGGSVRWKPMGPEVIEEYNRKEERHRPEAGAEEFLPHKFFFTSPSVRFAAQKSFAVPFTWQGRKAQVVLQTRQCPRFVRVAHTHKTPSIRLEQCFRPEEVSWFTRVYGPASILLTGVLFRFLDDEAAQG